MRWEGSRTEVAEGTEGTEEEGSVSEYGSVERRPPHRGGLQGALEGCAEGVEALAGYLGKGDGACLVRVVLPCDFRGIRASGAGGHDLLRW